MNRYVMCITNKDYPIDLTLHKVYKVLSDADAESHNLIRIIDNTGEDYLFPASWFVPVELPLEGQDAIDKIPA